MYKGCRPPIDSYEVYLSAYFSSFELFEKYFDGVFYYNDSLSSFVCRGMTLNLDFSLKMYSKYKDKFLPNMKYTYNARLIMSNIIPEDFKDFPSCIWYPEMPSLDTLNKLLKYKEMHKSIAVCSILLNNKDLFDKLDIKKDNQYLYVLCNLINSDFVTSSSNEYINDFGEHCIVSKHLSSYFPFCKQNLCYLDDSEEIYDFCDPNYYLFNMFECNRHIFPFNYNLVNEFDFERLFCQEYNLYDKLDNDLLFNLGFLDGKLPFNIWFKIPSSDVYSDIYNRFESLKYNVGMGLVKGHFNELYFEYNYFPDIDLVKMASISGNKDVYDDQVLKYKKFGFWFKHLDLDKKHNLDPPKIIRS